VGFSRVLNQELSVDVFYLQRNTALEPKTTKGLGVTVHISIDFDTRREKTHLTDAERHPKEIG
jgi:hypothetical protein